MVPPIKLWAVGVGTEAALKIMTRNSQDARSLSADLDAECAACLMGARRLASCSTGTGGRRSRPHSKRSCGDHDTYRTELLSKIPDGRYVWEDYAEHDGVDPPRLHAQRITLTKSMVPMSCPSPSRARYSHWIGTITCCAAQSAFTVRKPSEGGESITTTSYRSPVSASASRSRTARSGKSTSSTSAPASALLAGIRSSDGRTWQRSPRERRPGNQQVVDRCIEIALVEPQQGRCIPRGSTSTSSTRAPRRASSDRDVDSGRGFANAAFWFASAMMRGGFERSVCCVRDSKNAPKTSGVSCANRPAGRVSLCVERVNRTMVASERGGNKCRPFQLSAGMLASLPVVAEGVSAFSCRGL